MTNMNGLLKPNPTIEPYKPGAGGSGMAKGSQRYDEGRGSTYAPGVNTTPGAFEGITLPAHPKLGAAVGTFNHLTGEYKVTASGASVYSTVSAAECARLWGEFVAAAA